MTWNVQIERHRSPGHAWCEQCDIRPDKTREAVRQHVDRTGHVARFLVEDITTYRKRGQEVI